MLRGQAGDPSLKHDVRAAAGFVIGPSAAAVPGSTSHRRAASLQGDAPAAVTLLS